MNKLLVVIGPTATGKTSLGIDLAKKLNGEIISADSRQVYKLMDIGTGKDKEEFIKNKINVWGIDLVDPDYNFNVSDYVDFAKKAIADIHIRNKLPIIVGGTGLYVKALLQPFETVDIPPDEKLRNEFSNYSVENLQKELQKNDLDKWQKMNDSDKNNPRRLIRAIEIAVSSSPKQIGVAEKNENMGSLIISLTASYDFLYSRIDKRVDDRIKQGVVDEIKSLLKTGYTFDLPSMSASGYKEFKNYQSSIVNDQLTDEQIVSISDRWKFDEHAYARRQVSFINKFIKSEEEIGTEILRVNIENPDWTATTIESAHSWYINSDVRKKD